MRDLKVWFPLRKGLLRELVGGKPIWVRAVDGVDFDVRRGEIFCLVGESGCGKTTTGKALLQLVAVTEGDIFLEMPEKTYRRYADAKRNPENPVARRAVHEYRRRYSTTWKETLPWTRTQILGLTAMVLAAFYVAFLFPSTLLGLFTDPFTDSTQTLGYAVLIGLVLGLVGPLPPARPARRMPLLLTLLAVLTIITGSIPALFVHRLVVPSPPAFEPAAALAVPWEQDLFGMILAIPFGAIVAGGVSALVIDSRKRFEGRGGIRMRNLRRRLQLIFQDPYESLNPKQSVYEIVSEPLHVNRMAVSPEEMTQLVTTALNDVGLRPASEFMFRFPHELSGGQRQRVSIAAALVLQPDFIVADEPVSMLDVSIRTEILQLMLDLRVSRGITYLFITHDLSLAWVLADRIAVMYLGKIVETGTTQQVIGNPKHPYTKALISVIPSPDPRHKVERIILKGERPDPVDIPGGCRFHPRCPVAFEKCGWNAKEVADELRALERLGALQGAVAIEEPTPDSIRIAPSPQVDPGRLVDDLRSVIAANRDARRALTGIADIRVGDGSVQVGLHAGSEPQLVELDQWNAVACHLVTPPEEASRAITT